MNRTMRRGLAAAAVVLAALPMRAVAETTPAYFPESSSLDTTAYTLRLAGANRYATAATLSRVAAVNAGTTGGYPFNEPDRNEPGKAYGFATCPKTVGIAAGDTVADALAASSAKDRASLKVGDVTVDMTGAALLVTQAARQGASDLSPEVISALEDLADASCTFDAVIFGGRASVPAGAEATLDRLAGRVVRLAGEDRFATAARIASAVAAEGLPTVQVFEDADTSAEARATVILAEAFSGADALAVGPFAAGRNVPVLLTQTDTITAATRSALSTLQPDSLVVLGGEAAISAESEAAAAEAAGGAEVFRIGGADRYETSVMVAQQLFGIFAPPPPDPIIGSGDETHSNLAIGFARSEGARADHRGFSDALAAAWFLDTLTDKATAPRRLAPPVEVNADNVAADGTVTNTTIGGVDAPAPAPLLLVKQAEAPAPVADYVAALWPDPGVIKTADNPEGINEGGFGFVFGGAGAITEEVERGLATGLSGDTYDPTTASDLTPGVDAARVFYTAADFTLSSSAEGGGVDRQSATDAGDKVCAYRGALTGTRWLSLYEATGTAAEQLRGAQAVDYQDETVGAFAVGESRFQCVAATDGGAADLVGVSLSGQATLPLPLLLSNDTSVVRTTLAGQDASGTVTGSDVTAEQDGGGSAESTQVYSGTMSVTASGAEASNTPFTLTLRFTRSDAGDPVVGDTADSVTFEGALSLPDLGLELVVVGESATTTTTLRLAGMYDSGRARGGFVATVSGSGSTFSLRALTIDGDL